MDVKEFLNIIGSEFYTGVPDSLLRPVCDYLIDTYGTSGKHIIAANEGNAVQLRRDITWRQAKRQLSICRTAESVIR